MEKIFIYCAGGQGRHVALLIEQLGLFEIAGFIDENREKLGPVIKGYPVFSSPEEAFQPYEKVYVAVANGTPHVVKKIVEKLRNLNKRITFPNLIHPSVTYDVSGVTLGEGNIINFGTNLTTDITIGNFNYFNRNCVLGHDTIVGDFCNFNAGVILGGNVKINDLCYLGMRSCVIQGITLGKNAFLSAGAVINQDVQDNAIMLGPSARLFKYQDPVQ